MLWLLASYATGAALHSFDTAEYERYAHAALQTPLLHRLPNEYPAPALVIFLLPLALPLVYPWAFAIPVGIVLLVLLVSYGTSGVCGMDAGAARRLIVYLAGGALVLITSRYDLFAAAAAFWSLRAARQGRWSASWTWSSVGFLLKLFPAALWPVLLIGEWHSSGRLPVRRLWWMLGSVAVIAGLPALLDPAAAANVLHYYLHRPTEIGSLPAGLSVLTDWHGFSWITSYRSVNILSPVAGPLAAIFEVVGVAGCVAVWWVQAQKRLPMEAACLATLTLLVVCNKVLSTQYLIWLMPFWALYRLRVSWFLASVTNIVAFTLTSVIRASAFGFMSLHGYVATVATGLARDVLVLVGTWMWLRHLSSDAQREVKPVESRTPTVAQLTATT